MLPRLCTSSPCSLLALACRRGVSSKAKLQSSHDKRMEALVSLYHQSNTFVTPENLSAVIDQAFTQPLTLEEEHHNKYSARELYKIKEQLRGSPKFTLGRDGAWTSCGLENMGPGWTENRSRRVDRVYQTLMGTHKDGRPSWLALKENSERVKSLRDGDDVVQKHASHSWHHERGV